MPSTYLLFSPDQHIPVSTSRDRSREAPNQGRPRESAPGYRIPCPDCVHQIEMSPFLPFRNVTAVGGRAAGGRGAPGVAQHPTGARLSGARNRTTCLPSERELARLVERLSRP